MAQHDYSKILAIIDKIYAASVSDDWQSVIEAIAEHFDEIPVQLFGHDIALNKPELMVVVNHGEERLQQYAEHYHAINPWLPGIVSAPVGQVRTTQEYLPEDRLLKTEFYNDWIRPHEDIRRGAGVTLFNDDERTLMLGTNLRTGDQADRMDELTDFMRIVVPHIYRAIEIQHGLQGAQLVGRQYQDVLDQVGNAVILLDRQGRVCHQNAAADDLMRVGGLFHLGSFGALSAVDRAGNREIADGLAAIRRDRLNYHRRIFLIRGGDGLDTYFAMIAPLEQVMERTAFRQDFAGTRTPEAMLLVARPSYGREMVRSALQSLFQLTPAEASLAEALYEGRSLDEIADTNAVSIHTVRNQLKSAFAKTGTGRQGELVALVAQLANLAGR